MRTFDGLADEHRCQIGENKSLDKSDQYFDKINEHCKRDRDRRETPADSRAQPAENKDQRDQTDNNNVTRQHVREQTYDQRERLCEHAQEFHQHQYGFYASGYRRVENMPPIMRITIYGYHDERDHT